MSRIFQGSTDASIFEDFIEQIFYHYGRWPVPKSVLVMDDTSFYHTERIAELCSNAGVKVLYLPPYSPDLNPIEEFFAELKAFVRRNWQNHEGQNFKKFFVNGVSMPSGRKEKVQKVISGMRTLRLKWNQVRPTYQRLYYYQ